MRPGADPAGPPPLGDRLIVGYKLGKGGLEAAAAVILLAAAGDVSSALARLSLGLHEHLSAKWAHLFDAFFAGGAVARVHVVAAALGADALSSLFEGWAVWRKKRWAPWLIVIATGGLIPLEIAMLLERPTAARLGVLAVNAATVAYMVHTRMLPAPAAPRPRSLRRALGLLSAGTLVAYGLLSYLVLPWVLRHRAAAHAVAVAPDRAVDVAGQPSDPLNVGLVGTLAQVDAAMQKAGWVAAQPISRASAFGIAEGVLFHRSDPSAPVSSLFVDGRRQDLAFEQQVGGSPRRRHHVRFWLQARPFDARPFDARPLWLGAATYDRGVGLAHGTGAITHKVDPDIDAERDKLIADLVQAGCTDSVHRVPGIGAIARRPHGRVYTDGYAAIAVLAQP
jgi:uncharacterized membrane protein (DUF2068 family)